VYLWNNVQQKFIPDFTLWKGIISKREGDDIFGPE